MLDANDIAALLDARHANPFAVLGMHLEADGKLWVRVLLPGAKSVVVVDNNTGKNAATCKVIHGDGLFEVVVPRRKSVFPYSLEVQWHDGSEGKYADAFAFGPQLDVGDIYALRDGNHTRPYRILGAHLLTLGDVSGVRFAVWAPNAKRASVVGSFNNWDGRRHPMRLRHDAGVWEIFVPHAGINDLYKYEFVGPTGKLLPLKADPYAFAAQLRPETASKVAALPAPKRNLTKRAAANGRHAAISIYEVHAASWRFGKGDGNGGKFPSWQVLSKTLPAYAKDLGFTHIELMPISEYPFDGSWGYQTLGLYAPSARFGAPDGLIAFVAACHQIDVGVILDWVPAHFPVDAHGLAQFDGTALYEYQDSREGFHRDWNTLIYNFGRTEVRSFLSGNALYWLESFGLDGLRVDAVASMLYRDYSRPAGEWIPNAIGGRENLEAISLMKQTNELVGAAVPGAITLAEESTAFPGVSAPTYAGGLGFHYKWNMGWMNDTLAYMSEDPINRRWHHNKMTFGMVYAFSENFVLPISHDEVVHGKGSMLGRMRGDEWQRFANLRAYYGYMWGHPGKKLLFMGQEFAQSSEWNHDAELPWHLLQHAPHQGVQNLVRDLNKLYQKESALHQLDCDGRGFEWLVSDDAEASSFAWLRRDDKGGAVLVAANFTPVLRNAYRLGVPDDFSGWIEVLNTDSTYYGGSNLGNEAGRIAVTNVPWHGRAKSILITLPPLATLFFVPA